MAGCAGKCFDTTRRGVSGTVSVPTFAEQRHVQSEDDSAFDKLLVGDLIRSLFFLQERDFAYLLCVLTSRLGFIRSAFELDYATGSISESVWGLSGVWGTCNA